MSYANFASNVGLRVNYSLYAIPVAWTLALAPTWWALGVAGKAYDNSEPSESWSSLEKKGVSPASAKQLRRAHAATENSELNLCLFAACLASANAAKVPVRFLHICAGTYLTARSVYNLIYIFNEDGKSRKGKAYQDKLSYTRTLTYFTGLGSCFALAIKAAEQYRNSPW